jgi:homoserine kinase type II
MAVYTHLQPEELTALSEAYGLGMLHRATPIAEGVENSNYMLEYQPEGSAAARGILTVYEKRVRVEDVPFYLALMEHLAEKGLPCPRPLRRRDGAYASVVRTSKRAAMVSFLPGRSVTQPTPAHLDALGEAVARLHDAVADFTPARANDLALAGWERLFDAIAERADSIAPGLARQVKDELAFLRRAWPRDLPMGVVHADLFPDNVFFEGTRVSGLIDWYFACTDAFLYDVMITINAWCFSPQHSFDAPLAWAFLAAYQRRRPIRAAERAVLPILARGASLRFLLTRAYDWLHREEGALVTVKDPMEYARKLAFHQLVTDAGVYGL